MPAHLLALSEGSSLVLDKPILLVGRDVECDVRLDSRKISRRHCCLAQVGDHVIVRDLGSTNGVRVNGVRVVEGYLKAGDELTIGNHRFQVRWDAGDPAPESPRPLKASIPSAPADDGPFESLDEPVALAEPPRRSQGGRRAPPHPYAATPNKAPVVNYEPDQYGAAPPPRPLSDLLPEEIGLAPASDIFPLPPLPPRQAQ